MKYKYRTTEEVTVYREYIIEAPTKELADDKFSRTTPELGYIYRTDGNPEDEIESEEIT